MDQQINHLLSLIENSLTRLSRKLKKQQIELQETQKHLWYKQIADSLLALEEVNIRGNSQITILNLHTREKETISVNPKFDAPSNAKLYYKKAKKGARGEEINKKKVAVTEEKITKLKSVQQKLFHLKELEPDESKIREIETELHSLIPDKPALSAAKKGGSRTPPPPFRHFYTDGWDIYVGKSDSQNDELSIRFAAPSDIWLHVAAHPGSHVLIRKPKNKPPVPQQILKTAAQIAVWFSKAKHTSFAEVHYTEARFVRKRRHAPAGEVIAERCKSIRVSPHSPQEIFKKPFLES